MGGFVDELHGAEIGPLYYGDLQEGKGCRRGRGLRRLGRSRWVRRGRHRVEAKQWRPEGPNGQAGCFNSGHDLMALGLALLSPPKKNDSRVIYNAPFHL